jgi:hypothetical protein
MNQGDLFRDFGASLAAAAQEKDMPGWAEKAFGVIVELSSRYPEIHTDDVSPRVPEPAHFNAWGAVWLRAIRERVIERTGRYRKSTDPKKHSHVYPVYRSLIVRN